MCVAVCFAQVVKMERGEANEQQKDFRKSLFVTAALGSRLVSNPLEAGHLQLRVPDLLWPEAAKEQKLAHLQRWEWRL